MIILIFDVSGKGKMRIQAQAYGGRDMMAVRQIGRESMLVVAVPVGEPYDW